MSVLAIDPRDRFFAMAKGPLVFGRNDCAATAATLLAAAGRGDPFARWRGRYTTLRGFVRIIRRAGYSSLAEAVAGTAADMGWPEIDPAERQDMDLGLCRVVGPAAGATFGAEAPGIAHGAFWLVRTDVGGRLEPFAVRAWRTG
ncbi:MAG: hypothetical protein AB7F22_10660 [Reyranella sp.]|uniref:DUF6950 family protein n=1 Tax=Reyranella sp. TaxID=1929291 RepID=UPI003D13A058